MASLIDPRPVPRSKDSSLHAKVRLSVLKLLSRRLAEFQEFPVGEDLSTNTIIMEYFKWIGYHHSADMLKKETRLSALGEEQALQNIK